MPDRTTQRGLNAFEALLEMIEQNGSTPAGELPPVEHVAALRESRDLHYPEKVAEAHNQGAQPPAPNSGGSQ